MKQGYLKRITLPLFVIFAITVLALTGCGAETRQGAMDINQRNLNNGNPGMNGPNATAAPNRTNQNMVHRFDANTNMEMSQKIADGVAAMDEVENANVLIAGNNAYVAVKLHYGSGVANQGGTGTGTGTNTGSNMANMGQQMMRTDDETSKNGMMDNQSQANPNGGAAIQEVTPEIKEKIAAKVKSLNGNIKDVYVSANPDFIERMNVYADEFRSGRPLSGFVKELSAMVERVFPSRITNDQPIVTP